MSSPWGKPGAWALDAEEHEAELQQQQQDDKQTNAEIADFPSLAAAAAAATKTKKKNKGQTFSLAEFNSASSLAAKPGQPKGLTHDELVTLPTGPRQRSAEELDRSRLGGGFKNYGSNSRYGSNNYGDDSSNSRWGSGGGGGGSSRVSNRESNRELQSSRADEIDNWAAAKKSVTPTGRSGGGFFSDSQSKADESDSWISNKTEMAPRSRFGFERKSSFDSLSRDRGERDNWGRKKEESGNDSELTLRARPRLVLQPRSVPVAASEGGGASPTVNAVAKPKGANPFGEARPREEVLAQKGKDWKEIDEKLEAVKIKEEKSEMTSFGGRRGFGNGQGGFAETRSWRKDGPESVDATGQRFVC